MTALDLPPTPANADPVIVPGLLTGLGIVRRPVPAWVADAGLAESISLGHIEVDDEFMARDEPSMRQIEKRIAFACCFYLVVQRAYVADLERRVVVAALIAALETS